MVAKAGLGLIGLSAISVGGVALAKPHWLGMSDPMPKWHSLSEDDGFSDSTYSSGKFANKLTKYLVGVTNKKGGQTSDTNKDWWEWSFRRLKAENPKTGKFKYNKGKEANVEIAYDNKSSGANTKALNQICKTAYSTDVSTGFGTGDDKFNKSDVWKYCSPGLLTHTGEDNPLYPNGKIGSDNSNKTVLVSVKDSSNDWFWEIRNKDFWSADATSNDWSGSKATGEDSNKSLFKTTYEADKSKAENLRKTVKKLCEEAYTQPANPDSNSNNKDAKKFCALEASDS